MAGPLREVLVEFGVAFDDSGLKKGNKGVDSLIGRLKGVAAAVAGAFALREVVNFGKEILDQADALAKQSGALGVSADELQGWQWAAKLSGSSAEEFTSAFTKFTRNVSEASDSAGGPAAQAFKRLGVSIKDSSGHLGAPIDLLDGVVAGLQNIQDPAKRTAAVMDLFGKSGARLLPLFDEGVDGIAKLRQEVKDLGASFDSDFLQSAQEVNDNVDRLKLAFTGLFVQGLGPLLPGLVELSQGLVEVAKGGGGEFVSALKDGVSASFNVVRSIAKIAKGTGFLGAELRLVGKVARLAIQPLLQIEDFLVLLAGGKSVLGEDLDRAFGPGASARYAKAFVGPLEGFQKLEFSMREVNLVLVGIRVQSMQASDDMTNSFEGAAAAISDAFDRAFNAIIEGAAAAVRAAGRVAGALPGGGDANANAEAAAQSLLGGRHAGIATAQAQTNAALRRQRLGNIARSAINTFGDKPEPTSAQKDGQAANAMAAQAFAEAVAKHAAEFARGGKAVGGGPALASAPAVPQWLANNVQNTVDTRVVVNVPPGTDADMAARVGAAAGKGVESANLRAVKAAVVPGGP